MIDRQATNDDCDLNREQGGALTVEHLSDVGLLVARVLRILLSNYLFVVQLHFWSNFLILRGHFFDESDRRLLLLGLCFTTGKIYLCIKFRVEEGTEKCVDCSERTRQEPELIG
jgi:hypothetical protein